MLDDPVQGIVRAISTAIHDHIYGEGCHAVLEIVPDTAPPRAGVPKGRKPRTLSLRRRKKNFDFFKSFFLMLKLNEKLLSCRLSYPHHIMYNIPCYVPVNIIDLMILFFIVFFLLLF